MNVLYILADDMRADWNSYGLPVHTPNLDKLVAEGLVCHLDCWFDGEATST